MVVREDAQADHLSEELDFSYSHDTLTGLLNRSLFETDLRTLQSSEYDSMVCTYIDVVGLHEINNHLGHRSGDAMLCFIANAARKFFVSSRIYRIGGDEFASSPRTSRPTACGWLWTRCVLSCARRNMRSRWASRAPTTCTGWTMP